MELTDVLLVGLTLVYVHLWGLLSQAQADDCLSPVRWERLRPVFYYISITNDCNSPRYSVYTTTYKVNNSTFHVAALLCSHTRYKLLIKDSVNESYRDIADFHGNGEDHCELVGTDMETRSYIKVATYNTGFSRRGPGYHRDSWGEPFTKGWVDLSKSPSWYECGISIPSSKKTHGCNMNEKEQEEKKEEKKEEVEKEEKPDLTLAASLTMVKVIGCIIGAPLGFIALIFLTLKCIVDPNIQCKICLCQEEEPALHTPPDVAPASVPPRTPPRGPSAEPAQPAPSLGTREEGAPPTYEEAENYPLVRAAEAAPPPYTEACTYC